jgi:hypothetical protein
MSRASHGAGQRPELLCRALPGLVIISDSMSALSDSAEDRTKATSHSVTLWLRQLKQGGRQAALPLWERYFTCLVQLARTRFARTTTTGAASAQDVALEAFASFCRRAEEDGFARLSDRDDLWQILVVLSFRKHCN